MFHFMGYHVQFLWECNGIIWDVMGYNIIMISRGNYPKFALRRYRDRLVLWNAYIMVYLHMTSGYFIYCNLWIAGFVTCICVYICGRSLGG